MEVPFPEFPLCRVFVGGCVERGEGSSFRASAHTHISHVYKNWICVRSKKPETLRLRDGEPTNLMKHEYAHVLTGEGHTRRYWLTLARIGGYMERESYFGHQRKDFIPLRSRWIDVKRIVATPDVMNFLEPRLEPKT